jgi:hypothetical protein
MGFRIKHTMIAFLEEMFTQMLEGDNEEQPEEDLTLVICRNIGPLVELWLLKSCCELWAVEKLL